MTGAFSGVAESQEFLSVRNELNELQSSLKHRGPVTAASLQRWTEFRAEEIEEKCGLVENAKQFLQVASAKNIKVLCYPVMLRHLLHPLGNYTRRAMFPGMCKINQSSVDCHCKPL